MEKRDGRDILVSGRADGCVQSQYFVLGEDLIRLDGVTSRRDVGFAAAEDGALRCHGDIDVLLRGIAIENMARVSNFDR